MTYLRAFLSVAALLVNTTAPVPPDETEPIAFETEYVVEGIPYVEIGVPSETSTFSTAPPPVVTTVGEALAVDAAPQPDYVLPVDYDMFSREIYTHPHHDYPAIDIKMPVGTAVYAIHGGLVLKAATTGGACGGQVTIGTDSGKYMFCHLSGLVVRAGQRVETGWQVGWSGGRPGAVGAGSSSTPHLHVAVERNGQAVCPQPLLLSLWDGDEPNLMNSTRCHT